MGASQIALSQHAGNNNVSKDSVNLVIIAIEKGSRHTLQNVAILNADNDTIILSDKKGKAKVKVPKPAKYFTATHKGYNDLSFRTKIEPFTNAKIGSVVMTAVDTLLFGGFWKENRQSVLIAVNELMNFALATRYTYLLNRRESVGAHLSVYASWVMQGAIIDFKSFIGVKF